MLIIYQVKTTNTVVSPREVYKAREYPILPDSTYQSNAILDGLTLEGHKSVASS